MNPYWLRIFILSVLCVNSVSIAMAKEISIAPARENIEEFFNAFNLETMYLVDQFYDEGIRFEDPLVEINGIKDLKAYYTKMYQGVHDIRFEWEGEVIDGDTHVVFWNMVLSAKKLNKGKPVSVRGASHIRFGDSGKVVYHRDYFDVGAMVYEHVPVVGWLTRKVKKKLH